MTLKNKPFLLQGSASHACLMLHGLGGGPYEMQFLGEFLHQQGLTVQGIVYPGHDRPGKMPYSRWQDWYAHSMRAYRDLAHTHERVSLIGFSTGCPLGLYLASEYPVSKLVMLAPYFWLRHRQYYGIPAETLVKLLGWLIRDIPRGLPVFDPEMRKLSLSVIDCKTFNVPSVGSAMALINSVKFRLPELQNPILIIQPRKDTVVDPAGAAYLYDQIGSADKTIHWLNDSNHIVTLDRERLQVYEMVGNFLND